MAKIITKKQLFLRRNEDMQNKLKEIIELIKEHGPMENLGLEKEMVGRILSIFDAAGVKALVMLERPGKDIAMLANGMSDEAVSLLLVKLFAEFPGLHRKVIEKTIIIKGMLAEQDEDNMPPPEATIH
jgi:hypothetical protein